MPQVCLGLAGTPVAWWAAGLGGQDNMHRQPVVLWPQRLANHFFCDAPTASTCPAPTWPLTVSWWTSFGHRHPLGPSAGGHSLLRGHCQGCARMPSAAARRKASSTALPPGGGHLLYSATLFIYARPSRMEAPWTSTRCCRSSTLWPRPCATRSSTACGTGRSRQPRRTLRGPEAEQLGHGGELERTWYSPSMPLIL